MFWCFISHVTTSYLQHVFNVLKHLRKCFANNILAVVTFLQMFCNCVILHVTTVLVIGKICEG